jgi:hypothetical protein
MADFDLPETDYAATGRSHETTTHSPLNTPISVSSPDTLSSTSIDSPRPAPTSSFLLFPFLLVVITPHSINLFNSRHEEIWLRQEKRR